MPAGGYRPSAGRSSEIAELEQAAAAAGLFDADRVSGGAGGVEPSDDDPRLKLRLPMPPATVEEFYEDLGNPFEDSKTGEHITQLAPYQLRTCENLRRHRKLLILKSQKIGLSSLGIVATLHDALTRCQGYEIIIMAQSREKIIEHGRDMVKFIQDSKYRDYLIEKHWQVPGAVKSETTSMYHIYLQNRDLTSLRPTHIYLLHPSSRQIASLKRVKHVWASDITIVDDVAQSQESTFMALLSRLIMTEGSIFIECPTVGNLGPIFRLDAKFQENVKAGIIDRESGKVLRPSEMPPAVAAHTFFVDRIPVQEAVDAGVMGEDAVEALRADHGPMFPAYFEAEWFAGDAAWFGKHQLRDGTVAAARLLEDRHMPEAPLAATWPPRHRGTTGLPDLDEIQIPDQNKFSDCAWFHGLDPAARRDNFGIVVYGLYPKPDDNESAWSPFLRDVFDIDHDNMTEIITWVNNVLFRIYPPRLAAIDATRDTPVAEELAKKYGENRCLPLAVSNQLNYNMFLNAYKVFTESDKGSHEWPLLGEIRDSRKRHAVRTYKEQLAHERATYTPEGKVKFEKPPGLKNDVSRAGIMALEAVRRFQMGRLGNPDGAGSEFAAHRLPFSGAGRAADSIIDEAEISRIVAKDKEDAEQQKFDDDEEERYGRGAGSLPAEASDSDRGAIAIP